MAKLYEYGEGLLKTHVTWEDIQLKVKEIWGEEAVFGKNKSAESIGDGRGFMSKMCLIDPDWIGAVDAPKKFVVKISSQISMTEANAQMREKMEATPEMEAFAAQMLEAISAGVRRGHNTEINVYSLIEKYNISAPHPKIFAKVTFSEKNTDKGFLIMEWIEGALTLNLQDNFSVEDIKLVLKGLATLQAASLHFTEEELASLQHNSFQDYINHMSTPTAMAGSISMMRGFVGQIMPEKVDKLEEIVKDILDMEVVTELGPSLGMKPVLVHGDLWSTNLLWTKGEEKTLQLKAIVDYQTCHMSCPAMDLVRLFSACLSGKDRQQHWEELTQDFYNFLVEELKGDPAPYTFDALKEAVRRFIPLGGFMLVPMIGPVVQLNSFNPDEAAKAKTMEVVLEKVSCLLDDILKEHERNVQTKKAIN